MYNCTKSACIWGYFGPHFQVFGLNIERYGVILHIQSKYEKMRTRITPNMDIFQIVYVYIKYIHIIF